ncbi:SGNH/GDSL hydrolase family protein [Bacillus xiapuensis]|uniref:SGNH/GDSL hydrolase family protein n=1 Tax=Bacillus xiapuensis TaxID=2014075 RepID=UPI001E491A81|nr:SGNH/GDSL hydrolase family protein [Bacillus xiapuensis]
MKQWLPKDLRVVSIGDSLTEGVGDSTNSGGYVPYLAKDLEKLKEIRQVEFTNYGVKGNRTDQLLERLQERKVKRAIKQADIVIMTIGGNDIMKVFKENFTDLDVKKFNAERKVFERKLEQIIESIRKNNNEAGIVLVGLYNPFMNVLAGVKEVDEILKDWNASGKSTVEKYNQTCFVAVDDIFRDSDENLLYKDYFHPNDRGYERMAKKIFQTMKGDKLAELTNDKIMFVNGR